MKPSRSTLRRPNPDHEQMPGMVNAVDAAQRFDVRQIRKPIAVEVRIPLAVSRKPWSRRKLVNA